MGGTRENLAHRSDVTLLWPPPEPGGYSLIVDGRAEVSDADTDSVHCEVVPTRALLHRDAEPGLPRHGQRLPARLRGVLPTRLTKRNGRGRTVAFA